MNNKMTINSQPSTNEPKRKDKQQKQNLSKQLEEEKNQRNGHHMEGFQWGGGREEQEERVQGRRSIIGRQKIDGERSKMVWETELLCTTHGHELRWGMLEGWGAAGRRGVKGEKVGKL